MFPVSSWPVRFYGTAKTNKNKHPQDITKEKIKF